MVQTQEETIDGIAFTVTEFPAMKALALKARILGLVGPAFARIVGSIDPALLKEGVKVTSLDLAQLAPAIDALVGALTPEHFSRLCLDLMAGTIAITSEGKHELSRGEAAFNQVFSGQLETLYKALWFVLQVNRFFGLAGFGKMAATFVQKTKPPKTGSAKPAADSTRS